ncbi:DNA adenine methylase [Roseinatronobacter sp.]
MSDNDKNSYAYERRPSTKATSPFRYPGGKGFLTDLLRKKIKRLDGPVRGYAEPYCGGAGAATNLLLEGDVEHIYLNDLDPCVFSAWNAIIHETERFLDQLEHISVTVDEWKKQREVASSHCDGYDFDVGFATFFLNRTSRAGIVIGSGPIGGYEQKGAWKVDARFYRDTMMKRIERLGLHRGQITVSNLPAEKFIDRIEGEESASSTFIFIDPPYFEIGSRLYLNGMGHDGHASLAQKLKTGLQSEWLMTYDDHPEIRRLYKGFDVTELEVLYSLQRQRKVNEVIIQAATS